MARLNYRVNQNIKAREVRVIDQTGEQLGVMPTSEALEAANRSGLDLVEVAPAANPPVAKLLNFKQFAFERKKQEKEARKSTRAGLKEIRMRPNIGEADLAIRAKRAREFLEEGNQVKLTVVFRGREITHPDIGLEKINGLTRALADDARLERAPMQKGRMITATLVPGKNGQGKD